MCDTLFGFIQGTSNMLNESSSTSSDCCEVKDKRAVSDAAQIEIGKKLTKRKGQLRPQRCLLLFLFKTDIIESPPKNSVLVK